MKQCTKCHQYKSHSEFYRSCRMKDGYNSWCKLCLTPLIKKHKQSSEYKSKQSEYSKQDQVRERANQNRKLRRVSSPEKYRAKDAEERKRLDPLKKKAHHKVKLMVDYHDFPKASSFTCARCNERQAKHYHHHKGYEPEHWLDVIPLCTFCHNEVDHASIR